MIPIIKYRSSNYNRQFIIILCLNLLNEPVISSTNSKSFNLLRISSVLFFFQPYYTDPSSYNLLSVHKFFFLFVFEPCHVNEYVLLLFCYLCLWIWGFEPRIVWTGRDLNPRPFGCEPNIQPS
jgi:hypothetical protein